MFLASVCPLPGKPLVRYAWLRYLTAAVVCAALLAPVVTHASQATVHEVQQLMEQGQLGTAAQRVQAALKQDSGNMQLRFLQAVIAAEQQKYDQAIQLFTALTRDFPAQPEPYNNLAVLYAARGDNRKAAQLLEQAIRTHPSYATAHQNLGDIYARIANEAYAKALQLDAPASKPEEPPLALITRLHSTAAPVAASMAAPAEPQPAGMALTPAAPATKAATTPPSPAAVPSQAKSTPDRTATAETQTRQAVEQAIAAWARAWEQQDMNAYYAAYSPRFDPQGMSLDAWKAERKSRIVGKPSITVRISDLRISVDGNQAFASFRQQYASGGFKATTRKTLQLRHEGGKWRITREETGR